MYLVGSLALNLSVGHYRDLFIEHQGVVPMSVLLARFRVGPFGLSDAESLILVGLGCAFSLFAAIETWGLDDP
jgi:hypothetical protein